MAERTSQLSPPGTHLKCSLVCLKATRHDLQRSWEESVCVNGINISPSSGDENAPQTAGDCPARPSELKSHSLGSSLASVKTGCRPDNAQHHFMCWAWREWCLNQESSKKVFQGEEGPGVLRTIGEETENIEQQKPQMLFSFLYYSESGNSDRFYFLGPQNHCGWWLQPLN